MKTTQYRLTLSPEAELGHLVTLLAAVVASGTCVRAAPPANGDDEMPIAWDVARQLLEQLRTDVEQNVAQFPERYTVADQMPTS